jgi:uncharacterized protein DUF2752
VKWLSGAVLARIIAGGYAALVIAGFVIGATGPESWRQAIVDDGPGCPLKATTNIDCPFCGMTRATLAMGRGDLDTALAYHPLAPFVLLFVLTLLVLVAFGRTSVLLNGRRPFLVLAVIAAIWILRLVL